MKNVVVYSKEQLMGMPLVALRGLDIDTPEQENLIQEVVNIKLAALPPQRPIYRNDVPDINTLEEEKKWQDIINQRERKIRGMAEPVEVPAEVPVEAPPADLPVPEPTAPFDPEAQPLAEPTGEGEPVSFATGVDSQLQGTVKVDKRTKAYKDSLK